MSGLDLVRWTPLDMDIPPPKKVKNFEVIWLSCGEIVYFTRNFTVYPESAVVLLDCTYMYVPTPPSLAQRSSASPPT